MSIRFVRSYVSFRVEAYALKKHYLLKWFRLILRVFIIYFIMFRKIPFGLCNLLLIIMYSYFVLWVFNFVFRQPEVINGALINGLEARVSVIEEKMSDIDARTSEEADNSLNERELDRFIMSGSCFLCHWSFDCEHWRSNFCRSLVFLIVGTGYRVQGTDQHPFDKY